VASRTSSDLFSRAIARIDAANAEDPRSEGDQPKELVYSRRMTTWLDRLEPGAGEALRLAARAQHLCRWRLPRGEYPEGRRGYLSWRRACGELHAQLAAEILCDVGYDDASVTRVADLLRKKNLSSDPEALALEDTACLVFLEHELAAFAPKHDDAKLVQILQRTWRKMSTRGRALALELDLSPAARALLEKALGHGPLD
jgi:hypothetical protein